MKSKVDSFDSGITENNSGSHLTSDSAEIQSLSTSHGGSVPLAVDCQSTHSPSCYELQAPSMSVVICTLSRQQLPASSPDHESARASHKLVLKCSLIPSNDQI
jgi:hypothetical protein